MDYVFKEAELTNPKNGRPYLLVPGERVSRTPKFAAEIAEACNEGPIYDVLFRDRLKGAPYTTADALGFLDWVHHGWEKNRYFVFFIIDEDGEVVGCCDVKSSPPEDAEVGYWLRSGHSGIMTAAVKAMTKQALATGFQRLVAYTHLENRNSQKVLERCSFTFAGESERNGKLMRKYQTERTNHGIV